jgi:hypothetical protein
MKIIKYLIICIFILSCCSYVFADTSMTRDGEGQKVQQFCPSVIRSKVVGTKGFACFSTSQYIAFMVKVSLPATTGDDTTLPGNGSNRGFKLFYNGDESQFYPYSILFDFVQWNNSPTANTRKITSVCLRAYSSATIKTAYGLFN